MTAAVLTGYVLSLATVFSAPSAPPNNARLAHWLLAHHLDYGLGAYGTASTTTLDTGNQVHVAAVVFHGGGCYPLQLEAQASDYDPRLHDATFIVEALPGSAIIRIFGTPDRVYHVGADRVLVWHKNLLKEVQPHPRGF